MEPSEPPKRRSRLASLFPAKNVPSSGVVWMRLRSHAQRVTIVKHTGKAAPPESWFHQVTLRMSQADSASDVSRLVLVERPASLDPLSTEHSPAEDRQRPEFRLWRRLVSPPALRLRHLHRQRARRRGRLVCHRHQFRHQQTIQRRSVICAPTWRRCTVRACWRASAARRSLAGRNNELGCASSSARPTARSATCSNLTIAAQWLLS